MKEVNNVLLTGLLISKLGEADNADIKRPVLNFEIYYKNEVGEILFEEIPVLLPGGPLARTLPGLKDGGIYFVSGQLRNDKESGLYVEACKLTRVGESAKRPAPNALRRAELLKNEFCPNHVVVTGVVKEVKDGVYKVETKRGRFTKGDLKAGDVFVVNTDCAQLPCGLEIGETVVVFGQLTENALVADSVVRIREEK